MEKNKTEELQQMVKNKQKNKVEIQELVDQHVREILEMKAEKVEPKIFYMKINQTKLGMAYHRDREIMKRITTGHMIRVINFITSDPVEKRAYIESSMPEIKPALER